MKSDGGKTVSRKCFEASAYQMVVCPNGFSLSCRSTLMLFPDEISWRINFPTIENCCGSECEAVLCGSNRDMRIYV